MSPIHFAIIGSGAIASKHAQAMAAVPEASFVAVWSWSPEKWGKIRGETRRRIHLRGSKTSRRGRRPAGGGRRYEFNNTMKKNQLAAKLYTCRELTKTPSEISRTLRRVR